MRTLLVPPVLLLAACSPPPPDLSAITRELAALRRSMEEIKKAEQPTFDKEQALEDLTREVRRLRSVPPAQPALAAPAQAAPILPATLQGGALAGGVGGTQNGVNDLYWVLTKVRVDNEERVVLALYQAQPNGRGFKLSGVRMLSADLEIIEMGQDPPHVREVIQELKRAKK
jgi:hypothetical protein